MSTNILILKLAWRNLFRNPKRSAITLLAIVIGLSASLILASLARGLSEQFVDDAIDMLTGHIKVYQKNYFDDPSIDYRFKLSNKQTQDLNSFDAVWTKRLRVPGVILSERESFGVNLVGIEPDKEKLISFLKNTQIEGRFLRDNEEKGIIIGESLAQHLQTKLGRRVVLMSQSVENEIADKGFRIIGIYRAELQSTEKEFVFLTINNLQQTLGIKGEFSEISIRFPTKKPTIPAKEKVKEIFPGLDVLTWSELKPLVEAMTKIQNGFLLIWFFIFVVVASFGIVNTLFMSIFERTREIGLLISIGMRPKLIVLQIIAESSLLILLGIIIGNLLTFLGVHYLSDGVDLARYAEGTSHFGMSSIVYPYLLKKDLITLNIMIGTIGLLSSLYPARKASKLDPVKALRK